MRFYVSEDLKKSRLLKTIIILFCVFIFCLVITNFALFSRIGFTPDKVLEHYQGSEEKFIPAKTFSGMIEDTHMHFFAMAILMMTLTHLILFTPLKTNTKYILIAGSFLSAFLDLTGGWLIVYVGSFFVYFKLLGFYALQVSLVTLIAVILKFNIGKDQKAKGHSFHHKNYH